MTKKTYYTLILDAPARAMEPQVFVIQDLHARLIERHELRKATASSNADADFKETPTPQPLDERVGRALAKRHPAVFAGLDPASVSYYRFRVQPKGPAPLMQNYLVSLARVADFTLIENGAGESISFERLLADHAPVKARLPEIEGKSLEELVRLPDLSAVFQRARLTQPQNRCIEDLLMSDIAHHWIQAAEKINAGESPCDVLETLIAIYQSTKDLPIQRALLGAIQRVVAICAGQLDSVPAPASAVVAEFEARGKGVIHKFLGSRFATMGHPDLFGQLRDLAR